MRGSAKNIIKRRISLAICTKKNGADSCPQSKVMIILFGRLKFKGSCLQIRCGRAVQALDPGAEVPGSIPGADEIFEHFMKFRKFVKLHDLRGGSKKSLRGRRKCSEDTLEFGKFRLHFAV